MTLQEIAKATLADGSAVKAEVACQVMKIARERDQGGQAVSRNRDHRRHRDGEVQDLGGQRCLRVVSRSARTAIACGSTASFWRNQYGLNVDRVRVRRLEKQEIAELFAGTPERRAALERDWNDVVAMVEAMGDPRLRMLCADLSRGVRRENSSARRRRGIIITRGAADCSSTRRR